MRIVGLISDGRTSHGIYKPVLDEIKKSKFLKYNYIITGFHFDKSHGKTFNFIEKEGYKISHKVNLKIKSDNDINQLLILEFYISELKKYLFNKKIDIFLGQGDRIITLAASIVCSYLKIPFAHMHGGEKSGTLDETVRHVITKFSDIHFPASKKSLVRILKLGEDKNRVFLAGSTAAEYSIKLKKKSRNYIFNKYKINQSFKNFCVLLYNPDSSRNSKNQNDLKKVISSLIDLRIQTILIFPNNDPYSNDLINILKAIKNKNFQLINNFQFDDYLSILSLSKFLIGNSSGGIIETPSLKIPNIIVGNRQDKREIAKNSIVVKIKKKEIVSAIKKITSKDFYNKNILNMETPYLPNKSYSPSKIIINILQKINLNKIKEKQISY